MKSQIHFFFLLVFLIASGIDTAAQQREKIIMVRNQSRDLETFRVFAEQAARLKPFGQVQIEISALADKSWHEIPEGGSPWHEYACYISTPWKFFPHPDIAKHLPLDWIRANRDLMMAKAEIAREFGLIPLVYAKSTHFLPEPFFREHPELRGPRVDHPRRSNKEEFTWCTDLPETRDYIRWMITEMKKNIPDLATIVTGYNDSGAGLCWAAAQYNGPNGPVHCRNITTAQRVKVLSESIHQAAIEAGGDIVLRFGNANFWNHEDETVLATLPENTYINDEDASLVITGTQINRQYPFKGLVDPLEVLRRVEEFKRPQTKAILLRFTDQYYGRSDDSPEAVSRFIDVFISGFDVPTGNLAQQFNALTRISSSWGGDQNKEDVFEAFYKMNTGLKKIKAIAPQYFRTPLFLRVSFRYLNRPLLINPELLTAEEEAYFLPHVFNINENEARNDYIDSHGGRLTGTREWQDAAFIEGLEDLKWAANTLVKLGDAPAYEWFQNIALSLQMYVSLMRSIDNFYHAQLIRDRHKGVFREDQVILPKKGTQTGDPDYIPWNNILRDEYDNTLELIRLLENGGLQHVARAGDSKHEDTFLLGPDFLNQVNEKKRLMREHWTDIGKYLVSPLK